MRGEATSCRRRQFERKGAELAFLCCSLLACIMHYPAHPSTCMTSPFSPGARSHWAHYRIVSGGGLLLFGLTAFFGARAAYNAAFPAAKLKTPR